jgi:diguanylate cyclase (GGDEF)-like protein
MPDKKPSQNRILIIDDCIETIQLLGSMLRNHAQILFATDGASGIDMARQHQPHVILLDVNMPAMDGHAVCSVLQSNSRTRDCAIIFVTADASMENEVAGLDAGAVDFIAKPLNAAVVRARVRTHQIQRREAAALQRLATIDGMTGLYNRRYFDEQLETEVLRHRRRVESLSLAFIDIDHFKLYNDHHGHQAGDICLKRIAAAIKGATRRPGEIAARYGGEEFVVILPSTTAAEAGRFGEWVCSHVRQLEILHGASGIAGNVSISVGIGSLVPRGEGSGYQLVDLADKALYQAKSEGRNRSVAAAPC